MRAPSLRGYLRATPLRHFYRTSQARLAAREHSDSSDVERPTSLKEKPPYRFQSGFAFFAKRPPRPFPPPFLSPPSRSFSDPLSTHDKSRYRRSFVNGERIRGFTNGDDAVFSNDMFIGVNDGVGAWSTRKRGHAGLWSRLILHFWAMEIEKDVNQSRSDGERYEPKPIEYLQTAYEKTIQATSEPNAWQGTTTAAGAQLYFQRSVTGTQAPAIPILYVTNLGDSQILVIRPSQQKLIYKSKEQWHWFDCPRQLGTNSPDTPRENAVLDKVDLQENDVVLALSDGVIDNLWEHEIIDNVLSSISKWTEERSAGSMSDQASASESKMKHVAEKLMLAAKKIAQDPFAESPFMEHAVEEGLALEGGKLDDISVVAAVCKRANG